MKVTKVSIRLFDSKRTKAFVTVEIEEGLVLTGLTVVKGKYGMFVSFPQYKGKDGNYYSYYYATGDFKDKLEAKILKAYEAESGKAEEDDD